MLEACRTALDLAQSECMSSGHHKPNNNVKHRPTRCRAVISIWTYKTHEFLTASLISRVNVQLWRSASTAHDTRVSRTAHTASNAGNMETKPSLHASSMGAPKRRPEIPFTHCSCLDTLLRVTVSHERLLFPHSTANWNGQACLHCWYGVLDRIRCKVHRNTRFRLNGNSTHVYRNPSCLYDVLAPGWPFPEYHMAP